MSAKYHAMTKDKRFNEIIVNKLLEKREKHPNFELEVITNDVSYSVTKWEIKLIISGLLCIVFYVPILTVFYNNSLTGNSNKPP